MEADLITIVTHNLLGWDTTRGHAKPVVLTQIRNPLLQQVVDSTANDDPLMGHPG